MYNTEPLLHLRATSSGSPLWCTADGVHMTKEAYIDLAQVIMEAAHRGNLGETAF